MQISTTHAFPLHLKRNTENIVIGVKSVIKSSCKDTLCERPERNCTAWREGIRILFTQTISVSVTTFLTILPFPSYPPLSLSQAVQSFSISQLAAAAVSDFYRPIQFTTCVRLLAISISLPLVSAGGHQIHPHQSRLTSLDLTECFVNHKRIP